ncbi:rod shape-determining protein RodA [Candidatus Glomeribacter gigasporarum]|uniref:rod shape-determining protein RodA n=1 Tax=Candidatus Glomeribacter gigasporarum TaxID=132144 RepID=UPI00031C78D7|nr:rod shape-determining protein RodA [Candidatus Glomeribacter gigasporarum]
MRFSFKDGVRRLGCLVSVLDKPLVWMVFLLTGIGLLSVYSASFDTPGRFQDQIRNAALVFTLIWAIASVPPQTLMRCAAPLYTIGVALLIAVAMFGLARKGAKRWLHVGVVIQPSEIMKIAVPMMLAWYYHQRAGLIRTHDHLIALLLLMAPVGLIARQPDLGTAILVFSSGFFVSYLAGLSFRWIVPVFLAFALAVGALITFETKICQPDVQWPLLHDYQKHRVCTLLNPGADPLGKGFHTLQATIAIGSGGLHGKGWLKGTQTHLEFIPEKHTDFIFSVYAEEFGLIGGLALLALYFCLIVRGLQVAARGATLFGRLLAGSLILTLFSDVFVNIGMNSGLLPIVGAPLPLMSYGGTALVTVGIAVGLIMSVGRRKPLIQS